MILIIQTLSGRLLIALKHCFSFVVYFSYFKKWILCFGRLWALFKTLNQASHDSWEPSKYSQKCLAWLSGFIVDPKVPTHRHCGPVGGAGQWELPAQEGSL